MALVVRQPAVSSQEESHLAHPLERIAVGRILLAEGDTYVPSCDHEYETGHLEREGLACPDESVGTDPPLYLLEGPGVELDVLELRERQGARRETLGRDNKVPVLHPEYQLARIAPMRRAPQSRDSSPPESSKEGDDGATRIRFRHPELARDVSGRRRSDAIGGRLATRGHFAPESVAEGSTTELASSWTSSAHAVFSET